MIRALVLTLALSAYAGTPLAPAKKTPLTFPDGVTIRADVVDTPSERERGLMFRRKLPKDYGMLFVFPSQLPMSFWMKNTLIPLDMIFVGADKKITVIHRDVKASTLETPDSDVARAGGVAQYVLELPAGAAARRKLAPGDRLKFDVSIPPR